ncbi:MAG: endonuclease/exonuclease/phosphatase family protein [Patescibacteria group bacterium]
MKIKILTLNLFLPGSNKLFLNALDFLRKENPDILLLQEIYDAKDANLARKFRKREEIKKLFPEYFDVYMPVFADARKIEGDINDGQLILSKFPISEIKEVFIDRGFTKADHDAVDDWSNFPAGFLSCVVNINGKRIKFINMHGPVNLNGEKDDPRRMKLLNLIGDEIEGEEYVVAGGDSNAQPSTQLYSQLEEELQNPFKNKLKTTFNLKHKDLKKFPGYAGVVVDMLMCSKNFKVVDHSQPQVDVSDHLPLVIEIKI